MNREMNLGKSRYVLLCVKLPISSRALKRRRPLRVFPRVIAPPGPSSGRFPRPLPAASCSELPLAPGGTELQAGAECRAEAHGVPRFPPMLFPQLRTVFIHFRIPSVLANIGLVP